MELLKLSGIALVVLGFILKWDTIGTVVAAGLLTGFITTFSSDLTFVSILEILGKSFVNQRTSTLFAISVGVIGISERYGLKDKARDLIMKLKNITVGKFISLWLAIRTFSAAFSLRLGGHVQFIRPLILPMAEGAVFAKYGHVDEKTTDKVKGLAAASENYGNFFGQNCFMGGSGTLLIASTMVEQGFNITALEISAASWPVLFAAIILGTVTFLLFDLKLKSKYGISNKGE